MSLVDLRPGLRAFLAASAPIAALVVAAGVTHIYPVRMPQGLRRTAIVYNEISAQAGLHNAGADGLMTPRMQVAAWATTADAAHALALAIKERLHGYKGAMGSGATLVDVKMARFDSWRDIDDSVADLRGKVADYIIWYGDAV